MEIGQLDLMNAETKNILKAKNIGFSYADRVVFSGLTFDVSPGEKIAISGRNGSGKTHLLECLAGVRSITTGDLQRSDDRLELLSSTDSFAFNFTLRELFSFVPDFDLDFAARFASEVGLDLDPWMPRGVFSLSSGERQLVRLVCTFSSKKDIYLLDEPEVHLDTETRKKLATFLKGLKSSVIVVSHDELFRSEFTQKHIVLALPGTKV